LSLGRLLRILQKKWLTILLAGILGLLGALFQIRRTTPIYAARSTIEMTVRRPRILDNREAILDDGRLLRADEILKTRLIKFKNAKTALFAFREFVAIRGEAEKTDEKEWCRRLRRGVSFAMRSGTRLVDVSFTDSDPQVAADAANAYAKAAETAMIEENRSVSDGAVEWLQEQAKVQAAKLERTEKKLAEFRAENNVDILQGEKASAEESILQLTSALAGLESRALSLRELRGVSDTLPEQPNTRIAASLPSELPRQDQIVEALSDLQTAMAHKDELLKRYTEEHPSVIQQNAQVEAHQARLARVIKAARDTIANDLRLVENEMRGLQATITEKRTKVAELQREIVATEAGTTTIERERDACDVTYKGILKRIEEARLSADENTAIVKIVEQAGVPGTPILPKPPQIITLMVLLGLIGGAGLAFVTDLLDDRISSVADVERGLGLKVISVVPHVASATRKDLALATHNQRFSHLTECFAGIRSLLDSPQYRRISGSILVSSSAPEAGKTITSCNLAIASARSGKRTLLVDFDMRRPRLRGIFVEPGKEHSLLHVLAKEETDRFSELPIETECPNLDVVTSHPSSSISPAEIIGGSSAREFVSWATSRYERVVIDSPPYGLVSDAAVLGSLVGCTILVCRPKTSRKRSMRHAHMQLCEHGANVVGVLVNDIDPSKDSGMSNYYGYSYMYRHGYRYTTAPEEES